jgi:hypothetical protein
MNHPEFSEKVRSTPIFVVALITGIEDRCVAPEYHFFPGGQYFGATHL